MDTGHTHTAHAVQTGNSNRNTDGYHNGRLAFEENADHRHDDDVHRGQKTGFTCIGIYETDLLQIAGQKQRDTAEDAGLPQLFVCPALEK